MENIKYDGQNKIGTSDNQPCRYAGTLHQHHSRLLVDAVSTVMVNNSGEIPEVILPPVWPIPLPLLPKASVASDLWRSPRLTDKNDIRERHADRESGRLSRHVGRGRW